MNAQAALTAVSEHYETSCACGSAETFLELVAMFSRLSPIDPQMAFAIIAANFRADYSCFAVALTRGEVAILRPPHSDRLTLRFPELN